MEALLKLSRAIDAVNGRIGKVLSWLILVVVLISAANATVRKVFDTSSNAWLELQWMLFAVIFLLCSPWTLLSNEHIRIDIINGMLPKRWRDYHRCLRPRVLPAAADHHHDHHLGAVLPALVRAQRAIVECRRAAAMAGEVAAS